MFNDYCEVCLQLLYLIAEPVLQFQKAEYHVGEGDSYLSATIVRSGRWPYDLKTVHALLDLYKQHEK